MELTWGFLVLMAFFVLPGFIIRRLYFHDDFSKLYRYNENLLKTIFYSLIPGIINLLVVLLIYDLYWQEVDIVAVIDSYKIISNPESQIPDSEKVKIKSVFINQILPFLGLTIGSAIFIGLITGRTVRMFGLDTKWQILRFKNPWFYLFFGQQSKLKKFTFLKTTRQGVNNNQRLKNFLFTNADILVETSDGNKLYSGIVVDYELKPENNMALDKLILRNASRYSSEKDSGNKVKNIPGDLFVVDCTKMINLNLTYVYGENVPFLNSWYPKFHFYTITFLSLLIIPAFIFQIPTLEWNWYLKYFGKSTIGKIFYVNYYITVIQLFNPFVLKKETGNLIWHNKQSYLKLVGGAFITYILALLIECIAQWILHW